MGRDFIDRVVRAAKLDIRLYEEVEADSTATGQAVAVVVLSAVAAGVGTGGGRLGGFIVGGVGSLVSWYFWAYLNYWIGTRLLAEPQTLATHGELLRTMGFASSPGLVRVLGVLPGLRELIFLAVGIWMLVATVIAVRQALDYQSTGRAVGVTLIGWIVHIVILGIILSLFAGSGQTA